MIGVTRGVLFPEKLIHERSQNALEPGVGCIIRHDSTPPDPTPRFARLPHSPLHRYVSIPNWYVRGSLQWSLTAFPSPEAVSPTCGVANASHAFVESGIGSLP